MKTHNAVEQMTALAHAQPLKVHAERCDCVAHAGTCECVWCKPLIGAPDHAKGEPR